MSEIRGFHSSHPARGRFPFIAIGAILIVGCTRYEYDLTLTPRGPELERSLRVSQSSESAHQEKLSQPSDSEVARLEEVYGQEAERRDDHVRLTRSYTDAMPQDVGGNGSYTHWKTSLGSASFYVERFRGSDDHYSMMQRRLEAADMAVDMVWAYVDAEADDSPAGERLRDFVDDELRQDAKDAVLLVWALQIIHQHDGGDETEVDVFVRSLQFLVEHNYTTIDAAAEWMRELTSSPERQFEIFVEQLSRNLVLTKSELLSALPSLNSQQELAMSFNEAVLESNVFIAWRSQFSNDPDFDIDETQAGLDAFGHTVILAAGWPLADHDQVQVHLELAEPPIATNGTWDDDGAVEWSATVGLPGEPSMQPLPSLSYAVWSKSDVQFQMARFGKVLLEGEQLGEYVIWRRGLSDEQGHEWEAFLASLTPEDDLADKVQDFRFSESPPGFDGKQRMQTVMRLLLPEDNE